MTTSTRKLYLVTIYNGSDQLAVWERFAADEDQAFEQAKEAAQREWPDADNLEVWASLAEN
jgi:hypothetical protein